MKALSCSIHGSLEDSHPMHVRLQTNTHACNHTNRFQLQWPMRTRQFSPSLSLCHLTWDDQMITSPERKPQREETKPTAVVLTPQGRDPKMACMLVLIGSQIVGKKYMQKVNNYKKNKKFRKWHLSTSIILYILVSMHIFVQIFCVFTFLGYVSKKHAYKQQHNIKGCRLGESLRGKKKKYLFLRKAI